MQRDFVSSEGKIQILIQTLTQTLGTDLVYEVGFPVNGIYRGLLSYGSKMKTWDTALWSTPRLPAMGISWEDWFNTGNNSTKINKGMNYLLYVYRFLKVLFGSSSLMFFIVFYVIYNNFHGD